MKEKMVNLMIRVPEADAEMLYSLRSLVPKTIERGDGAQGIPFHTTSAEMIYFMLDCVRQARPDVYAQATKIK